MFNTGSRLTTTKLVVGSADSGIESADSTADFAANPLKIGLWVLLVSATPGYGCHHTGRKKELQRVRQLCKAVFFYFIPFVFVLCWQLSLAQLKYTCNAKDSTFILY